LNRLRSKQLGYLNNMAIQKFGTQVGFLSKKDASLLTNELINA